MSRRKRRAARGEEGDSSSLTARCSPSSIYVRYVLAGMEAILLALVCLTPWTYGTVHPNWEFVLDSGIAVLLALWAVRMLLEGQFTWKKSGVALCLAGLFLVGVWQRTPLPRPLLARLSPGTVQKYEELLPEQPEILPNNTPIWGEATRPGSTISLYPGATLQEAARLLAVFLVFVVVYNNLTSKQTLIRLSWVALGNGVLLSIFAIAQFFGAPPSKVYWTHSTLVTPFGPFICHNHFPDYITFCIGLGIGLLVSRGRRDRSSEFGEQDDSPLQILQNPRALWIGAALGLMVCAVAFSRSRGGMLALVGAAVVCGILGWLHLGRSFRLGSVLLVVGVALALSAWLGIGLLKNRLATLGTNDPYESRIPVWLRSLLIVKDFPIWGIGYGAFGYIEPMYRQDAPTEENLVWWEHAHNDYLEFLVEGGIISLGLVLLAVAIVYRRGYRALIVHRGHSEAGLALGALFGFVALSLHSFGDFGAHIPAVTLIATVVCAHLCALGTPRPHKSRSASKEKDQLSASDVDPDNEEMTADNNDAENSEYRLRLGGIAPVLGAIAALSFGLVLCAGGYKGYRIDRLRDAAFRERTADADQLSKRIACLTEATSLGPQNVQLHYELGSAHDTLADLHKGKILTDFKAILDESKLALQEHLRARNACPLLSGAQLGIARHASLLVRGDSSEDYIRRVKLLTPGQDQMWYLCGFQEFQQNRPQDAWKTWRHCLELSKTYLPQILDKTKRLNADKLVEKVLPDKPDVILAAALQLYPDAGAVRQRRPILKKALRLLEAKTAELGPQDLLTKARIYKALDEPEKAVPSYRDSLDRDPSQVKARFEFARYLYELRKLEDAGRELRLVVAQEPTNEWARGILEDVKREMLRDEPRKRPGQR